MALEAGVAGGRSVFAMAEKSPRAQRLGTLLLIGAAGLASAGALALTLPAQAQRSNPGFFDWFGTSPSRPRQDARPAQTDFSRAPAPARKPADAPQPTSHVMVLGDSMADWLAYGLEDALSETPEFGVVRKHRTTSGLLRYDPRNETQDWAQAAREIIAAEKPNFIVMMVGLNDRQSIRERVVAPPTPARGARGTAPAAAAPAAEPPAQAARPEQPPEQDASRPRPTTPTTRRSSRPSRRRVRASPARTSSAPRNGPSSTPSASTTRSRRSRAAACRCSGSACPRSAVSARPATWSISTKCSAPAPRRPASSSSTCGTASSTKAAALRCRAPISKARSAACAPATACISPRPARASSRTMSSASFGASHRAARWRSRCRPPSHSRSRPRQGRADRWRGRSPVR